VLRPKDGDNAEALPSISSWPVIKLEFIGRLTRWVCIEPYTK
jgi:hypothetical protein